MTTMNDIIMISFLNHHVFGITLFTLFNDLYTSLNLSNRWDRGNALLKNLILGGNDRPMFPAFP